MVELARRVIFVRMALGGCERWMRLSRVHTSVGARSVGRASEPDRVEGRRVVLQQHLGRVTGRSCGRARDWSDVTTVGRYLYETSVDRPRPLDMSEVR